MMTREELILKLNLVSPGDYSDWNMVDLQNQAMSFGIDCFTPPNFNNNINNSIFPSNNFGMGTSFPGFGM